MEGCGDDRSDRERLHGRQGPLCRGWRGYRRRARAPCGSAHLAALLAGRRRRRLREVWHGTRWGTGGHGQLPGQGADARRPAVRCDAGAGTHSRNPSLQPARVLRRVRRQGRRPRCGRPGALCRLDRLGQGAGDRPRLQPDLLFTSQSGRQHHAVARRSGDPHVLDQPRHRLPAHRRGDGQGARQGLHHQPVDSRRHEGLADRPRRAARTADRIPGHHLQGTNQPLAQPRLGRGQTLRNRV